MNESFSLRRLGKFSTTLLAFFLLSSLAWFVVEQVEFVAGYTMPPGVDFTMDDLVADSGGAVIETSPGVFQVTETVEIPANSTLTVGSGESVLFDAGTGFLSFGTLRVTGTTADPALFDSSAVDSAPGIGLALPSMEAQQP